MIVLLQAFNSYLEENSREKRGNQSRRSLADLELTKEQMEAAFRDYNELFLSKEPQEAKAGPSAGSAS